MRRIVLVPLDGSPFAEQALPFALTAARAFDADIELVRVQPVLPLGLSDLDARQYLEETAVQIGSQLPGRVHTRLMLEQYSALDHAPPASNAVADVLRRRAGELEVLLIVMVTHGFGGVTRAWLGSVADSLIRSAPRPVLLIRPAATDFSNAAAADRGFQHILVPLDGSQASAEVLPQALAFGGRCGARFTLLRVTSPLTWQGAPQPYDPATGAPSPLSREAVLDYLDDMAAPLRAEGAEVAVRVVDAVSAANAILDYAAEHAVDAIVIGTQGAGRVRRLLLGSVTDKVVRGADVPVLVCNVRTVASPSGLHARAAAAV
jgi:nucleotide-binding universal stress UspA family protein